MPLHIAVVGAGLVGLGAAISLGRQGHQVDIYEKSRFAHEVGAAIHVGPMAQRCLASWGLDLEEMKPVESVTLSRISVTDDHSEDMHLVSPAVDHAETSPCHSSARSSVCPSASSWYIA